MRPRDPKPDLAADPFTRRTSERLVASIAATQFILCCFLSLVAAVEASAQTIPTKNVLVLFDERTELPGLSALQKSISSTLNADTAFKSEIYVESMNLSRFQQPGYEDLLSNFYQDKYKDKKIDVVIAVLTPSLSFALEHMQKIAPNAPIVFCGVDARDLDGKQMPPGVTGVVLRRNFAGTLDLALKVQPETRQVVLVSGTSEFDQSLKDEAARQLKPFEDRVSISYLGGEPINNVLDQLSRLPPHTIVLYTSYFRDGAGESFVTHEVATRVSEAASVPVYGFVDQYLGRGIVGGHLYTVEAHGSKAAELALRILHGEAPKDIPYAEGDVSVDMFDARQLKRWGISENALPAGSVVQFKPPGVWEEYKWYWFGLGAVIVAEALLIGALLVLQFKRRQAETANVELASRLEEIVANVPGIVWETRTDPSIGRRRTTYISDYVEKLLGYSPEEWLAKPPGFGGTIVQEEDRDRVMAESDAVVETGKVGVSEFRWNTKDGRVRWVDNYLSPIVDEDGKVVGLRGVALDITDRKEAQATADEAEEKDRALLSAIPDLMFLQTLDGVYLDYHAKDRSELLVPPETFVGKNMRDVLPTALAERFAKCFAMAKEGEEPQILEYSIEVEGAEKWFEARMVRSGDRILSIVRDITDLKRTAQEAHELSGRLIRAQEDERARLARELHDGVSQNLALFSIELALFGRDAPHDKASVDEKMKELSSRVAEVSGEIRRLSQELHPVKLEQLGLVTAVRGFCHEVEAAHDIVVDFEVQDVPASVPRNVSLSIYRIVQESLQNIVKHSGAANAHVLLSRNGHGLKLKITDDGCGFMPKAAAKKASLGLVSMRERVHLLNGSFSISSEVGKGTKIEATVPVEDGH